MLEGQDIICLAPRRWEPPWKNSQQVMSRIARDNRVLYVGPPRSLRSALPWRSQRETAPSLLDRRADTLYIYGEPWFLSRTRWSRWFNWVATSVRMAHVRLFAQRLGFRRPILWVYDPMLVRFVGSFHERLLVYHVIDNYDEYYPYDTVASRWVAQNHRAMLRRADLVFAVSEALLQPCRDLNPNSYLVPNGVDYPLFREAMSRNWVPDDARNFRRPVIGYVGVMQPRVDFRLLQEIATRRPNWSFLLVGPTEYLDDRHGLAALVQLPNVQYLGPKPLEQIPYYIKACDLCILPYKRDGLSVYGDSLKLYEYLACGRPVVSTDIPCSRRFMPLVRIADDPQGFIDGIEVGLAEDGAQMADRMAIAEQQSWDRRIDTMRGLVGERLTKAGARTVA